MCCRNLLDEAMLGRWFIESFNIKGTISFGGIVGEHSRAEKWQLDKEEETREDDIK